jgi:hypothetical protein
MEHEISAKSTHATGVPLPMLNRKLWNPVQPLNTWRVYPHVPAARPPFSLRLGTCAATVCQADRVMRRRRPRPSCGFSVVGGSRECRPAVRVKRLSLQQARLFMASVTATDPTLPPPSTFRSDTGAEGGATVRVADRERQACRGVEGRQAAPFKHCGSHRRQGGGVGVVGAPHSAPPPW